MVNAPAGGTGLPHAQTGKSAAAVGSPGDGADALPDGRLQAGAPHPKCFAILHHNDAPALKTLSTEVNALNAAGLMSKFLCEFMQGTGISAMLTHTPDAMQGTSRRSSSAVHACGPGGQIY